MLMVTFTRLIKHNNVICICRITNFVSSDHCNGDYFEVREDNIGGPLLRRICSFTPQETSIESEKKLFIKMRAFRNDGGSPEELRLMYHRCKCLHYEFEPRMVL